MVLDPPGPTDLASLPRCALTIGTARAAGQGTTFPRRRERGWRCGNDPRLLTSPSSASYHELREVSVSEGGNDATSRWRPPVLVADRRAPGGENVGAPRRSTPSSRSLRDPPASAAAGPPRPGARADLPGTRSGRARHGLHSQGHAGRTGRLPRRRHLCGLRRARGPGPHRGAPAAAPHGGGHRLRLRPGARPSGRDGGGPDHRRADDPPPPRPGPGAASCRRGGGRRPRAAVEQDLFAGVDELWRTRRSSGTTTSERTGSRCSSRSRSPLWSRSTGAGPTPGWRWRWSPPPGTPRARSRYLLERGGRRLAFTGDLIYAPGKVWSLAATQWSYTDNEGPALTVLSCYLLAERDLDLLLPSHGRR